LDRSLPPSWEKEHLVPTLLSHLRHPFAASAAAAAATTTTTTTPTATVFSAVHTRR
jgi:hypothetical protein